MSAKGIPIGTFSGNGTFSLDVSSFHASRWGMLLTASFGAGTLSLEGGDGTTQEPLFITDDSSTAHFVLAYTLAGLYVFDALCAQLDFVLTLSTAPTLEVTLFPEARP